jgi:hypothetical protein
LPKKTKGKKNGLDRPDQGESGMVTKKSQTGVRA